MTVTGSDRVTDTIYGCAYVRVYARVGRNERVRNNVSVRGCSFVSSERERKIGSKYVRGFDAYFVATPTPSSPAA